MKRAALMLLAAAVVVVAYSCGETEPPENRPPRAVGAIPAQEVMAFDTVQLDLSQYFADDDGDNLSYSATSGTPRVVRVAVSGSTLLIIGRERGAAAVTVVARDPDGLWATQNISVEVLGTPGFLRLELHYDEVDIGAVVLLLEGPPADSIQAADGLTLYRAPAEGGVRAFVAGPIPRERYGIPLLGRGHRFAAGLPGDPGAGRGLRLPAARGGGELEGQDRPIGPGRFGGAGSGAADGRPGSPVGLRRPPTCELPQLSS